MVKYLFGERNVPTIELANAGNRYSHKLRGLITCTSGILQKLFACISVTSPYSMTDKVISHYNQIESIHRSSLREKLQNVTL